MKAPLPKRIARVIDILVAAATLTLAGMMLWDREPGSRDLIMIFVFWSLGWLVAFFTAPSHPRVAWAVRFVLSSTYFVDAAWDWRKANGETHAYMIMAGIPLAALLLLYLVLFALSTYVLRRREQRMAPLKTFGFALLLAAVLSSGAIANSFAATLHGRVKDRQCLVLSQATVRIHPAGSGPDRTLSTDEGGNYTLDLPAGNYQVCVQREAHAPSTCTDVFVAARGDTWVTTQLRDAVPDLSNIGNRAY